MSSPHVPTLIIKHEKQVQLPTLVECVHSLQLIQYAIG